MKPNSKYIRTVANDERILARLKTKMQNENISQKTFDAYMSIRNQWTIEYLAGKYKRIREEYALKINKFLVSNITEIEAVIERNKAVNGVEVPKVVEASETDYKMPNGFKPYKQMIMPRIWAEESQLLKRWRARDRA
jgi:hypothetical protein